MANLAFPPIAAFVAAFGASLLWALPTSAYQTRNKHVGRWASSAKHESCLDAERFDHFRGRKPARGLAYA